jgi:hypothetical protein
MAQVPRYREDMSAVMAQVERYREDMSAGMALPSRKGRRAGGGCPSLAPARDCQPTPEVPARGMTLS